MQYETDQKALAEWDTKSPAETNLEKIVSDMHGYPFLVDLEWCVDTIESFDDSGFFDAFPPEGGGEAGHGADDTYMENDKNAEIDMK
eukprot:6243354-Karenia_brevis.AAC.1